MLPPPMTMASSMASSLTSLISRAMAWQVSGEMPCSRWPSSASPLSFNITRRYLGVGADGVLTVEPYNSGGRLLPGDVLAKLPAHKTPDHNVFAKLRDLGRDVVLDRDLRVLHERLLHQADLRIVFFQFARSDLLDGLWRFVFHLRRVDFLF